MAPDNATLVNAGCVPAGTCALRAGSTASSSLRMRPAGACTTSNTIWPVASESVSLGFISFHRCHAIDLVDGGRAASGQDERRLAKTAKALVARQALHGGDRRV